MTQPKLTKKEKRALRRQLKQQGYEPGVGMQLRTFQPLTNNQRRAFESYYNGKNLMLYGSAGTGKTFLSMYLSLQEILESDIYQKLVIVRSAVPSKNQGFLPGSLKEKTKVYESPYYAICSELFGRGDAYDVLKSKNKIEFHSTSYNRGITFSDCIILVDEIQNLTAPECDTIITRAGDNCKIIFAGDIRQTDLVRQHEQSGMSDFIKILQRLHAFDIIEFGAEDIVRSRLVKAYIMARNDLEDRGTIRPLASL